MILESGIDCDTCSGMGSIKDADTEDFRRCLDCGGRGYNYANCRIPKLVMSSIRPGDKDIFINSVEDHPRRRIEIKISRDDCDTVFAESFAEFLVELCNNEAIS